jgi:hypothetical protein
MRAGEAIDAVPGEMNDQISSIRTFGGDVEVTVYQNRGFSGRSERCSEVRNLQDAGWNDRLSSLQVDSVSAESWRVTLDESARKVVVDTAGVATDVPMNDLIEVGVFGEEKGVRRGEPLNLRMHRIRSGEQRIVLTVPRRPAEAGIDPRHLLIDTKVNDNVKSAEP